MMARTGETSPAFGSVRGMYVKTRNVATMETAENTAMRPPQMRMQMRAQLRRRRMYAPTKMPKMFSANSNSQNMLVMARTASGSCAALLSEAMRDMNTMETSTRMAASTPNIPKRMATIPAAVIAGWDFGMGSMKKAISPLQTRGGENELSNINTAPCCSAMTRVKWRCAVLSAAGLTVARGY